MSYVECHGDGPRRWRSSRVAALTQAFRVQTARTGSALGSVKANIAIHDAGRGGGRADQDRSVPEHGILPPSLHFEKPNPRIDFASSPFYVINALAEWRPGATPRRAGVSSFGIGGTNAHVVLEEAPSAPDSGVSRPWQLLVLSAKTAPALDAASARLAEPRSAAGTKIPTWPIPCRRGVEHRASRMWSAAITRGAVGRLRSLDPRRFSRTSGTKVAGSSSVPGGGPVYELGLEIYEEEPAYRSRWTAVSTTGRRTGSDIKYSVPVPGSNRGGGRSRC